MTSKDRIGVMVGNLEPNRLRAFAVAASYGFRVVHANAIPESWLFGPERAPYVAAARDSGLDIATQFVGFDGQDYSSFYAIARTVGLVPQDQREHRRQVANEYGLLAKELGITSLAGHLGFLPSNPAEENYQDLVRAVQIVLGFFAELGVSFHLETGQDSATDLLRFVEEVDRPNLGINFDPGNFLLYGTDDPLHALDILAPLIRGFHCKDAIRSHQENSLGIEVPLGRGEANFPVLLDRLRAMNYSGPIIIEREQASHAIDDILEGRKYLENLLLVQ